MTDLSTGNQVGDPATDTIIWQIDGEGTVLGFIHNNEVYYYLKNAQGDIVGIADKDSNIVANYTYDSWGKLVSIIDPSQDNLDVTGDTNHIGYINPLRYRGYYYDSETSLYYLNTRYYDPETCRFINSDNNLDGGLNLFAYCGNDPVNAVDYTGKAPHGPGHKFRTIDPWEVYWEAGEYVQTLTLADPDDVEYAFVVYKGRDALGEYYSYDIERGDPGVGTVDPARLINNYLKTGKCPDRLFGHTHGKDPRDGLRHFNEYSPGDYSKADSERILLGLFPPDGSSQMYDGRSGVRTTAYFMTPPRGIKIPRDPYYDKFFVGFFRRQMAKAQYI